MQLWSKAVGGAMCLPVAMIGPVFQSDVPATSASPTRTLGEPTTETWPSTSSRSPAAASSMSSAASRICARTPSAAWRAAEPTPYSVRLPWAPVS